MSLKDEIITKRKYGLTDQVLEDAFDKYYSGSMPEDKKQAFETDFPEFIKGMIAYKTNQDNQPTNFDDSSVVTNVKKPVIDSFLSGYDPVKLAELEHNFQNNKMSPEHKEAYAKDRVSFLNDHRGDEGADLKARLAVGAETDPERKLAVIKKYYPDAVPFGNDNFIIQKDGKNRLFKPTGLHLGDFAGAAPEIVGAVAGTGVALGTGGTAAAIGGSAVADAGAKRITQEAIRAIMGNNDIQGIKEESLEDKAKEFGIDTGLGILGGAIGHGVSKVGGGLLDSINKNILRPMEQGKATKILTEIENASPHVQEALNRDGLLLSTAYPSMDKVEGAMARIPIVGKGIQDASQTGGLLLTDSIEQNALKKAGMNQGQLSGSNPLERSKNILDDIHTEKSSNYEDAINNILAQDAKTPVELNNFKREISRRLEPFETSQPEQLKLLKQLKSDIDFNFVKKGGDIEEPAVSLLSEKLKGIRDKIYDSRDISPTERFNLTKMLHSLEQDLESVVPDFAPMNKDYANKSTAEFMLKLRGGTNSADLPPDITSPNSFVTAYNKLMKQKDPTSKEVVNLLENTKELASELKRSKQYENTSNTALANFITSNIGNGLLGGAGAGIYSVMNPTRDQTILETAGNVGKGLLGGVGASLAGKQLLKGQALNAIRRSANPSEVLNSIIKSSDGGILDRALISALGTTFEDYKRNGGYR